MLVVCIGANDPGLQFSIVMFLRNTNNEHFKLSTRAYSRCSTLDPFALHGIPEVSTVIILVLG